MARPKGGLGKGLDALFIDSGRGDQSVTTLRISEIEPNLSQPRKAFEEKALAELSQSIGRHGVLQPLLVRPLSTGMYQIVAGERRWRAARMAGLTEVPVLVRELDDSQTAQIALIENLQREDLNPIEEAEGYRLLMEKHGLTQEEVAECVGRSRPAVANMLRLLSLPAEVLPWVKEGRLSVGHAKAILGLEDPAEVTALARETMEKGLTVREVERRAAQKKAEAVPQNAEASPKPRETAGGPADKWFREMEAALRTELGRPIKITPGKKGGTIEVPFYNKSELAQIAERLVQRKTYY